MVFYKLRRKSGDFRTTRTPDARDTTSTIKTVLIAGNTFEIDLLGSASAEQVDMELHINLIDAQGRRVTRKEVVAMLQAFQQAVESGAIALPD